jgi:hypothetical protein
VGTDREGGGEREKELGLELESSGEGQGAGGRGVQPLSSSADPVGDTIPECKQTKVIPSSPLDLSQQFKFGRDFIDNQHLNVICIMHITDP